MTNPTKDAQAKVAERKRPVLARMAEQVNYLRFTRDIHIIAMTKGVWDVIDGTEPILSKPNRDDDFGVARRRSQDNPRRIIFE